MTIKFNLFLLTFSLLIASSNTYADNLNIAVASNISLCKTAISDSRIFNIIGGPISAIVNQCGSHVLLQIHSRNDLLLARITQKSYQHLALGIGQTVYMQIKAVSTHGT